VKKNRTASVANHVHVFGQCAWRQQQMVRKGCALDSPLV